MTPTRGARAAGPLVSVNIAAVPETLLEAEFFGVAPGAYTGAERKGRMGKFKLADGGTLFLDEIGDMPLPLQAKLLRALQEGEIEALGSNKLQPFDARVIAATSRDLTAMVQSGRFREDLYYRLNVLPIRVPALRDRPADIPALVEILGEDLALRSGTLQPEWSPAALSLLSAQTWRGNVRELRNLMEQISLRSDSSLIGGPIVEAALKASGLSQIEPVLSAARTGSSSDVMGQAQANAAELAAPPLHATLAQQIASLERQAIDRAMTAALGNKAAAARLLGLSRATLYQRLGEPK